MIGISILLKRLYCRVTVPKEGLGAVLLQDSKPAKVRYANIEREMHVIVFGYLKYHYYLYSRRFI